jgi:hypothetical protein
LRALERKKPPLFSDGYGSGAVRELGDLYTATVTVAIIPDLTEEPGTPRFMVRNERIDRHGL